WPSQPVKLVVAFPPGGSTDITARLIAPKLSQAWGQPVIVENRPGAGANIGTAHVARSAPDGQTILVATTAIAISPGVYANTGYDALADFAPVSLLSTIPNVLVVHPSVPAQTIEEFVAWAKAEPGRLNFAAPGAASGQRMTFELVNQATGMTGTMIAYKGGGPALQAVMGGEVHATIANVVEAVAHVQAGRLRPLAVTTRARSPMLPEVPTLAETVAPAVDASVWQGVLVPSGTPAAVVARINRDLATVLADPEVQARMTTMGMDIVPGSPQAFRTFLEDELKLWKQVVSTAGIKME
ncbi:MAG: tripartite tricarboxylate transporter substrate binding protein, partial [Burkholderiaceae bacterium]